MRRPVVALLGLLVALGALVGIGTATTPTAPAPPALLTAAVQGSTLVCPELRQTPAEGLDTRVSAGVVRLDPSRGGTGTVQPGAVSSAPLGTASAAQPTALTRSGRVVRGLPTTGDTTGLVLTARGAPAGGLQAEQLTRASSGSRRGEQGLACTAAQADSWFAGGSVAPDGAPADGRSSTLVLANPDRTAAVVDVQVWSAQGPAEPRLGLGIVVPAQGRTSVPLATLAPGSTDLALHVRASQGRVVAAVEDLRGSAGAPLGAEWVPISPAPAARLVLPALPAGPGPRTLLVTNPGPTPTVVQVQLTTGDAQFVPTGLATLPVPAGTTVSADLTALLAGTPGAVAVTSQAGPVLAVGLAVDGSGTGQDISYAGAAAPLGGPALVPETSGGGSVLLLSALAADALVVVTPLPVAGDPRPLPAARTVRVPGGRAVLLRFADLGLPGLAVEVEPAAGSGPVRAAVYLRDDLADGPLTTLLALVAPAQKVTRPVVVGDAGAGLP